MDTYPKEPTSAFRPPYTPRRLLYDITHRRQDRALVMACEPQIQVNRLKYGRSTTVLNVDYKPVEPVMIDRIDAFKFVGVDDYLVLCRQPLTTIMLKVKEFIR